MSKVKMINTLGNEMWVSEDRVEEYLKQGHRLPEEPKAVPKKVEPPEVKPATAKKVTRKARK